MNLKGIAMLNSSIFSKIKKEKIIVFGTGSAAINYIKRITKTHEIVIFLDNDPKKHGKKINGISIFRRMRLRISRI